MAELLGRDPIFDAAEALEAAVLADPYFTERRCFPNVDFHSTVVYHTMGTPRAAQAAQPTPRAHTMLARHGMAADRLPARHDPRPVCDPARGRLARPLGRAAGRSGDAHLPTAPGA